jgi:hypothetical protein
MKAELLGQYQRTVHDHVTTSQQRHLLFGTNLGRPGLLSPVGIEPARLSVALLDVKPQSAKLNVLAPKRVDYVRHDLPRW